jgi:hypothetical protein
MCTGEAFVSLIGFHLVVRLPARVCGHHQIRIIESCKSVFHVSCGQPVLSYFYFRAIVKQQA